MKKEKTYAIFTTRCIHNTGFDGNFEFNNRLIMNVKSLNYDEYNPAFTFKGVITTDKDFKVRNHFRSITDNEVILTLIDDGGTDYDVEITFYNKDIDSFNSAEKWTTEPLIDQELWGGLNKKQIDYVISTLSKFYKEYTNAKNGRQLSIRQLQKEFLTDCNI